MREIKAVYVGKETIKVHVSKSFYNGISTFFRISDCFFKSTILNIVKIHQMDDEIIYYLEARDIVIGEDYYIASDHNLQAQLSFDECVNDKDFLDQYYYDGNDLGANYSKLKTTFKVFAPTRREILLEINDLSKISYYKMEKDDNGVFSCTVEGDLELANYAYLVKCEDGYKKATDPYAYSSTINSQFSVVIDPLKCYVNQHKESLPPFKNYNDAIIYELHIRDFSMDEASNIKNKGKYVAFLEHTKTSDGYATGIDYIKSLGVTHLQLMPFFDFGSVDEANQFNYYNWGYDPVLHSIPEGSYATSPSNPYSRIIECKQMISSIHQAGLRVNMDVVYNHLFSRSQSNFETLVPNYYFRTGKNFEESNGSFCGNDFESLRPMARKYIVDSCLRWADFYGVDGFRFDLMGLIDIETMNEIYEKCSQSHLGFMVYGEGWNMPTLADKEVLAIQQNSHKMPNIAFFNDAFRDGIKGGTSVDKLKEKGYALGNSRLVNQAINCLTGLCLKPFNHILYKSPKQSINYVECHDNSTLWDKLSVCEENDSEEERVTKHKFISSFVFFSQGIAFINAGQEFCRTKQMNDNTYNLSDDINKIDYSLMVKNIEVVNYFKDMIALRKKYHDFRYQKVYHIKQNVKITAKDNVILYSLLESNLLVIFNACKEEYKHHCEKGELIFNENGATHRLIDGEVIVPGFTTYIIKLGE